MTFRRCKPRCSNRAFLMAALVLAVAAPAARAQSIYPDHTITLIVPFSPGGGTDIAARLLAAKLSETLKQAVVVENRGGAGGILGADAVAKAKPDGYTLLIGNVGTQSINESLYAKLPYDPHAAFAPISMICELPFALVINPNVPATTAPALVALAKPVPGQYTFGSSGNGGSPHLTGEIFQQATGVKFTHVPYKGGGPAMADLMAGHVDMLFVSILEISGYVSAGKLRALAITSAQRSPAMPNVPTLAEQGIANAESGSWVALLAPAGTPKAIVDKLSSAVRDVVALPDVRTTLIAQGATPRSTTPAELQGVIDADKLRYERVIRSLNLKVD